MKRKRLTTDKAADPTDQPVALTRQQVVLGRIAPLVQQSAGKVTPLAHSAVGRVAPLTVTAAERINAATGLISPYATTAAGHIAPLAVTAAGRVVPLAQSAAGRVAPLAAQAVDRVTPYRQQAVDLVSPYAHQAADRVTPYAAKVAPLATAARARGAQVAHDAAEALDGAFDRVTPAVDAVRGKVTEDLLPRVTDAISAAAAAPAVVEATKRGKATLAAARGELTVSAPEPATKNNRWVKRLAIVAALAGVAAVVVKRLLGHKDADWQAARPTTPYVAAKPASTTNVTDDAAKQGAGTTPLVDSAGVAPARGDASAGDSGAYVGSEPPEGFFIKGNENSMKYHTPESGGYADTVAEVWFSSEQAAQDAGFARAGG